MKQFDKNKTKTRLIFVIEALFIIFYNFYNCCQYLGVCKTAQSDKFLKSFHLNLGNKTTVIQGLTELLTLA